MTAVASFRRIRQKLRTADLHGGIKVGPARFNDRRRTGSIALICIPGDASQPRRELHVTVDDRNQIWAMLNTTPVRPPKGQGQVFRAAEELVDSLQEVLRRLFPDRVSDTARIEARVKSQPSAEPTVIVAATS